jgi:hypothetical protein
LLTGGGTSILQEAEVRYISRKICNSESSYAGVIPNTSFCAGDEDGAFDTCRVRYFLKSEGNPNKAFDYFLVIFIISPKHTNIFLLFYLLQQSKSWFLIPWVFTILMAKFRKNLS